jgi:4-carboxymuconolactone decarboxylase
MCSLPNCAELATTRLRRSASGDLTREETIAYDLASALVSGGVLPELTYLQAVNLFGEEGAAEFIYLVGLYCMVSVTLNGFDVPVLRQ